MQTPTTPEIPEASESNTSLENSAFQLGYDFIVYPPTHEIGILNGFEVVSILKIEPRLMQVLICLAQSQGSLVSRKYLVKQIWDNYGGGEDALMQTISKLRKFLQDDAKQQKVIQTIPKQGYRLLLPVRLLDKKMLLRLRKSGEKERQIEEIGPFTGFVERLTRPKFFLAFLFFSFVVIFALSVLSYLVFWIAMI